MSNGMDLKVKRIRAKVTQEQLAKAADRSRSWVTKVESGSDELPAQVVARYEAGLSKFLDVREVA